MNALQFLLDYSNASEYEDKRDETTNTWLFFANAMEEYHKHKVNNGVLDGVSNRRELLIAFYANQNGGLNNTNKYSIEREVDKYLSIMLQLNNVNFND
jgi:hypothetical protein